MISKFKIIYDIQTSSKTYPLTDTFEANFGHALHNLALDCQNF